MFCSSNPQEVLGHGEGALAQGHGYYLQALFSPHNEALSRLPRLG